MQDEITPPGGGWIDALYSSFNSSEQIIYSDITQFKHGILLVKRFTVTAFLYFPHHILAAHKSFSPLSSITYTIQISRFTDIWRSGGGEGSSLCN